MLFFHVLHVFVLYKFFRHKSILCIILQNIQRFLWFYCLTPLFFHQKMTIIVSRHYNIQNWKLYFNNFFFHKIQTLHLLVRHYWDIKKVFPQLLQSIFYLLYVLYYVKRAYNATNINFKKRKKFAKDDFSIFFEKKRKNVKPFLKWNATLREVFELKTS